MKKKGISPLIATVLILGFTVALAAIIMTWGTGFTKRMQTQTEETANIQVICATDVVFDIQSVCKDTESGDYKLLMSNDGKEDIVEWRIRLYQDEATVDSQTLDIPINQFSIGTLIITPGEVIDEGVRKVEALPVISRAGKDIVYAQNIDTYGSTDGDYITNC